VTEGTNVSWSMLVQLNLHVLKILDGFISAVFWEQSLAHAVPQAEPGHSLGGNEKLWAKTVPGNRLRSQQHG